MKIKILDTFFRNLLNKFVGKISSAVDNDFNEGSLSVLSSTDKTKHLKPIPATKQERELLDNQIYDNIKKVTDEMNVRIKNEIRNSILNNEDNKQLAARLDRVFKGTNPTNINYESRLKMIARTERTRVLNQGAFKTANRLGFTHKYIDIVRDKRTAGDSYKMYEKYGSKDKAIPIDEEFHIVYNGKEQRGLLPPLRPQDRENVLYITKE